MPLAWQVTLAVTQLIRKHDMAAVATWLVTAKASGIAEFRELAAGKERDWAAITAACRYDWSTGQTEARVLHNEAGARCRSPSHV